MEPSEDGEKWGWSQAEQERAVLQTSPGANQDPAFILCVSGWRFSAWTQPGYILYTTTKGGQTEDLVLFLLRVSTFPTPYQPSWKS